MYLIKEFLLFDLVRTVSSLGGGGTPWVFTSGYGPHCIKSSYKDDNLYFVTIVKCG